MPVELRFGELRRAVALRGTCPHRPLMLRVFERVAFTRRLETLRGDALLCRRRTLWLLGAPGAGRAMHGEPLGWLGGWAQRLCTTA